MQEELKIDIDIKDGIAMVKLTGYINMNTSDELYNRIKPGIFDKQKCYNYIFDVDKLEYVSSAGVGVIMDLYVHMEAFNGKICFLKMKPDIRRVFELVGFLKYFGDVETEEQARDYFNSGMY